MRRDERVVLQEQMRAVQDGLPEQDTRWVFEVLPKRAAAGWRIVQTTDDGVAAVRKDGLRCIVSGQVEEDGKRWLHLSLSRAKGLPTYHDLKAAKRDWLGEEGYAYQVFAPPSYHVNVYEVLHIFQCVDQPQYLPDFTRKTGSL